MRCGVLGELVVVDGPRTVRVGRSTRAVVLAALLCDVGCPLAVDELVDLVWGDAAPTTDSTDHTNPTDDATTPLQPTTSRAAKASRAARLCADAAAVLAEINLP